MAVLRSPTDFSFKFTNAFKYVLFPLRLSGMEILMLRTKNILTAYVLRADCR